MIINLIAGIFSGFIITIHPIGSNTFSIIFKETVIVNDAIVICLNCVQHTKHREEKSQ
jgi:hypothetical protein